MVVGDLSLQGGG